MAAAVGTLALRRAGAKYRGCIHREHEVGSDGGPLAHEGLLRWLGCSCQEGQKKVLNNRQYAGADLH
jgi:hypothetical protein